MSSSTLAANKRALRAELRSRRRGLSGRMRQAAAASVLHRALRAGLLLRYRRIGFYLPHDGELDLLPLLNQALWLNKACFLPALPPRFSKRLWFNRIGPSSRHWRHNRFGILEHGSPRPVRAWQLDLLFVPLVGFDAHGNRLGMGGGFYDASLAHLRQRKTWRRPLLVGVGYACQRVERLPDDPWDIRLDALLSERRFYRFCGTATDNFSCVIG